MALRKASAYSKKKVRPYTRRSSKRKKAFIKAVPPNKIVKYNMGSMKDNIQGKHNYVVSLVTEEKIQIRDNSLESCRVLINKNLDKHIPGNYYFVIKTYPHHILRENKTAAGAGADRLSSGMTHSFGITVGRAAIVPKEKETHDFVRWFSELSNKDVPIAGGKGASLAEMYNAKIPVPPGFVITAQAYTHFLKKAGINEEIKKILSKLNIDNTAELNKASRKIREVIEKAEFPKEIREEIIESYEILDADVKNKGDALGVLETTEEPFVAVRSSATTEDLADASFAGQQETFLNVRGKKALLENVRKCMSSLFTPRAIFYREKKGFAHDKSYLAVVVQKMVASEKSGVMFSQNPTKDDKSIVIEAVFGLGEGIVSGQIKPDHYVVSPDLDEFEIMEEQISVKKIAIIKNEKGENETVKLNDQQSRKRVLDNYQIKRLSQYARELEEHYQKPQDIEFAIDKIGIYIVQSRPITTQFKKSSAVEGDAILSGLGASPGVGSGVVKVVHDIEELEKVKDGDVLVTEMTNPDMVVSMQKAAAIITDEGGITSHAAIVSREMGIPAVVGTGDATKKLKDGDEVTADLPEGARRAAESGAKAIGLTRLEGIIAIGGKHPLGFLKEKKIKEYIHLLSENLKKIAEPFDEIWVRSSDIRTDEYRNLKGAPKEDESNPMMGGHGIRLALKNKEIFAAEISAVKEVADDFPDKKIGLMIPLVISVDELKESKKIFREIGLPKNVKIGIMVETPAAVQTIEEFCREGIDFASFGTNDLTQFTLAVDRNNERVQDIYDETHPAVLASIKHVIEVCKRYNVETSICGQAGSRPEMAKFLVECGISSISVNADAARKISMLVAELEGKAVSEQQSSVSMKHSPVTMKQNQEKQEQKTQHMIKSISGNFREEDIEDAVLKELGSEDDYSPGNANKREQIPSLNDSIPVESEMLQQHNSPEKEIELEQAIETEALNEIEENITNELGMEWRGEKRRPHNH